MVSSTTMFTFSLPLFSFLLLLLLFTTTTTAQPYTATDRFFLDCGSASPSTTTTSDQRWDGDEFSKFVPSDITTTSFSSTPTSQYSSPSDTPYTTARIFNTTSFTYIFPVSEGPKFLRLHFFPATYSDVLDPTRSFFSVSSNGYSLLTNFSAFLSVAFERHIQSEAGLDSSSISTIVKEFIVYVKDTQFINVTFTPSQDSYAFINGIEIVSMPESLYFNGEIKNVDLNSGTENITDNIALETMYRLNVGGSQIPGDKDTGMYRSWDQDNNYAYWTGNTPTTNVSITYTNETKSYTAPEQVYLTQRSMGNLSGFYNLTWALPVDSGFYYMIRLHFCNIIPQYTKRYQVIFRIFINNKTAEKEVDLFIWTPGSGYPIFKDYGVFVDSLGSDGRRRKKNLSVVIQPNVDKSVKYGDGFLNGLEAFKLSMTGNLSSPNPELISLAPPPEMSTNPVKGNKKAPLAAIIGGGGGGLLLSVLVLVVLWRRRRAKRHGTIKDKSSKGPNSNESKDGKSVLPSDRCHRFTFAEVNEATNGFNEDCVVGVGGFGKVYKGYMNEPGILVAIKRLNPSSKQGFHEFRTEIGMLSKLRHVHLVSLIGYCDENGEMILVYDFMAHGTLREHLYKSNNPSLSWETRLRICIGAAQGLLYLHTGKNRAVIHRDVKSTNILLDENWVAKVSDFGLSKLGPRDQAQSHVSTLVKGSVGYVDPDYYRSQQLTEKSDVYSFGVVLLEVLCARPVIMTGLPKEQVSLAAWAKYCYRKGTLDKIIDPKLMGQIGPDCLSKFVEVANSCLHEEGTERPTMEEVVWKLEFALQQQENAEKMGGDVGSGLPDPMQGDPTTTDDEMLSGSSAIRIGTSSISTSFEGFHSETVFSEMLKPTER